jgi:hypothetical protein
MAERGITLAEVNSIVENYRVRNIRKDGDVEGRTIKVVLAEDTTPPTLVLVIDVGT